MLAEIDDGLVEILQREIKEIPKENIVVALKPSKLPAITITNSGFRFENTGLAENVDEGSTELKEQFNSNGVETSYKLRERPLQGSVQVECPQGTSIAEEKDYVVDYHEGVIRFRKPPPKGKNKIDTRYLSKKRTLRLKNLRMKAKYSIDVWGEDRVEVDSIAERVIKTLLVAEDELAREGVELKPVGGRTLWNQEDDAPGKIRLRYLIDRTLSVKKLVLPMEKIQITSKS